MEHSDNKLPNILSREIVASSRLFKVESVKLEFSNGFITNYECLKGGNGAVMVIPFDGENFIFTKEYCVGTNSYELGFVKGKIDNGEEPIISANRELQEEIGLGSRKLTHLRTITFAPGFMSLLMHIYLAEDLYTSKLIGDEPEEIKTYKYSIAEAEELLHNQNSELRESRFLVGLMHALEIVKNRK